MTTIRRRAGRKKLDVPPDEFHAAHWILHFLWEELYLQHEEKTHNAFVPDENQGHRHKSGKPREFGRKYVKGLCKRDNRWPNGLVGMSPDYRMVDDPTALLFRLQNLMHHHQNEASLEGPRCPIHGMAPLTDSEELKVAARTVWKTMHFLPETAFPCHPQWPFGSTEAGAPDENELTPKVSEQM